MKEKRDAADALLAAVARHLAKADTATRQALLQAVLRLAREPNGETIGAFAEAITAAPLNPGARRSVIGAVMNALPRSAEAPPSTERASPSIGSDQAAEIAIGLTIRSHKGRNTGQEHNIHTGTDRNHRSGARPLRRRLHR